MSQPMLAEVWPWLKGASQGRGHTLWPAFIERKRCSHFYLKGQEEEKSY